MAQKKSSQKVPRQASAETPVQLGIGWYTPSQWLLLKQSAMDADKLDDSYEEWLSGVKQSEQEFRRQGYSPQRVMIDVESLIAWCHEHGRPLNSSARAEYTAHCLQSGLLG